MEFICQQCGNTFKDLPSKPRRFCSTKCYWASRNLSVPAGKSMFKCDRCGNEFERFNSVFAMRKEHYCSDECARLSRKTRYTINCRWCDRPFEVTPTEFKNGRRLCSMKCRLEEKDDGKNKICEVCGKSFRLKYPSFKTRTCSFECGSQLRIRGEFRNCSECGKPMWVMPVHFETQKFCSRECLGRWHSKTLRGENHPGWNGGSSFLPYTQEWTDELKSTVRQRDGNLCKECGSSESLSVHHIDYDKTNCSDTNLITLCNSCHVKTNFNRAYWQERYSSMIISITATHTDGRKPSALPQSLKSLS